MPKYHISINGEPAVCRAFKRPCPVGGEHFDTMKDARGWLESKLEALTITSLSKNLDSYPLVMKNGELVRTGLVMSSNFIKEVAEKSDKNEKWSGTWEELENLVMKNMDNWSPGTGSVDGDVRLVHVPSEGFYTNIVEINDENKHLVETVWEARVEKEDPVPIRVIMGDEYAPAHHVDVVLYRADVLAKDDDRSSIAEWEIVSVNSKPEEFVPMHPNTMKRNASNSVGGTLREYSKEQWEESEKYWDSHVYVRLKKQEF